MGEIGLCVVLGSSVRSDPEGEGMGECEEGGEV
jgi:hypothetical protein